MSSVALLSLAVAVYTYLGYPALITALGAMRRFVPRPAAPSARAEPTVSVLIPVWAGEPHLDAKLASIARQTYPPECIEILVGIDGSTDGSEAIARAWAARDPRIEVLPLARRCGKAATLNHLAARAAHDVLVFTDVRPRLAPDALRLLVRALGDPRVGCATGALHLLGPHGHGLYWRYEQALRRAESRFRGMVGATGPLYAVRREAGPPFDARLVVDDLDLPMRLARRGLRTALVEEARVEDVSFPDRRELERRIRNLGGNWQLLWHRPWLLVPLVNPLWLETISHKVLRLLVPFCLITLAVDSLVAVSTKPSPIELTCLGAQLVAYGLALAGFRLGSAGRLARTFVLAQVAIVIGLWRAFTGRVTVLW